MTQPHPRLRELKFTLYRIFRNPAAIIGFLLLLLFLTRIFLLLRSPAELPGRTDHSRYLLGDKTVIAPGDGYVRRVITTSVRVGGRVDQLG